VPAAVARAQAAVVGLEVQVAPGARSAATLGTERAGTATVIEAEGLAVTVGYLVLEATRIDALLPSGARVRARVVGHDFESGLALIRLDPAGAPYAAVSMGRSASVTPGQPAAIVGVGSAPPGVGVPARVTAVGPFVAYWEYRLERAIFVKPHHPGFGGAALVAPDGTLVGVVSLRLADGHLAIPIDLLAPVRAALLETGRPARPSRAWLGLRAVDAQGGVGVAGVTPGSPAEAAGLRAGDLILRVNGERVPDVETFYQRLWAQRPGQRIELGIWRDGALATVVAEGGDRYRLFETRTP